MIEHSGMTRRTWMQHVLAGTVACASSRDLFAANPDPAPVPVAGIVTVYRKNSHADVLIGKILEGYRQDGGEGPALTLKSLYVDQFPDADLSRGLARKHGFRLCHSISDALTLGTGKLQVQGVLSIGEHGEYGYTADTGQHLYPRRRFFDEIAATFREVGAVAPVFNDKHLSWNWEDTRAMVEEARELRMPFMAGSSLPVAWREPALTIPIDSDIGAAVAIGYGGAEAYGFHALETLQCMVERRRGGETGIKSVKCVTAEQLRGGEGLTSQLEVLITAALEKLPDTNSRDWRSRISDDAVVFRVTYRDGLQAAVAMLNGVARQFGFACSTVGEAQPLACWFRLEESAPYGHFAFLLQAIEAMCLTGKPAYPVERTVLTTGVLDAAMHSRAWNGSLIETRHLGIAYQPVDWPFANQP